MKSFSERRHLPTLVNAKKANSLNLLSLQTEAISLVAISNKELWLVQGNHATVKLDLSVASRGIKTYSEARNCRTAKSTILKENARKVESVFVIRAAQWAEGLECCLEYCRSLKIRSDNLRLRSTWRPLDSSLERKGTLATVEICVLCYPSV